MQNKSSQLFILPYAGGSIMAFKKLTDLINKSVSVQTVEYPGRGTRAKEPLADSIWSLLDDAVEYINAKRNPQIPYALMGYSMGSILAYEMLAQKKIHGELMHLFICAEISPKKREEELCQEKDPTDEEILHRARKLGGIDERMVADNRFYDIYLKPMLSDYRLLLQYRYGGYEEKLKVDTTFFYCEKDTSIDDINLWKDQIDGKFDFHEYGKNHFFINHHYNEIAEIINSHLKIVC